MTIKDLFILLIKLFGLYSIIKALSLASIVLGKLDIMTLLSVIISLVVIGGLFWLLTFNADKIVDVFKLESGFSEKRIEFGRIKSTEIIKLGTFIIGGLLIIDNIPSFLSKAFWAFKGDISGLEFTSSDRIDLTIRGLNIILGYLLATNFVFVSKLIGEQKEPE